MTAADLEAIAADEVGSFEGKFVLESFRVVAATGRQSRARDDLARRARHVRGRGRGRRAVDAVFRAMDTATNIKGRLTDFRIDVTGGKDALGEVRVSVEFERRLRRTRPLRTSSRRRRALVRAVNVYGEHGRSQVGRAGSAVDSPQGQDVPLPGYGRLGLRGRPRPLRPTAGRRPGGSDYLEEATGR